MSLELWSETQAYVVSVLLVNLIVLFEDTENWSRATRLVNSVGGISRVRKRFSSNSGISWLINIGVSHLVKQEWELNVCVCVCVAVELVCLSAWMARLDFVFLLVSKKPLHFLQSLEKLSGFNTITLK